MINIPPQAAGEGSYSHHCIDEEVGRYPPPPVSRNHLAQEPTPGSAVEFSHHFFLPG